VRQARSRCLRCCPGVTVTTLGRPPHRACEGHGQHLQIHSFVSDPDDRHADHLGLDAALRAVEQPGDDRPRERPMVSRGYVVHCPPLLLPGRSACPPSTSSKIIPHISRAVRVRLGYQDQPQAPSFCAAYLVAIRIRGTACRISGRGSRSRTGDRGGAIDAVPARRATAARIDGSAQLRLCDVDRALDFRELSGRAGRY
jgi:hypothetical protein